MTDQQLQLALAKMLPDRLVLDPDDFVHWSQENYIVDDKEWLHVCWLVEQQLIQTAKPFKGGWSDYVHALYGVVLGANNEESIPRPSLGINATWQQRATALCKVKGIKP